MGGAMTDHQVFRKLEDLAAAGVRACLATITWTSGSTPLGVGARMIVLADGSTFGSIGGGCVESGVRAAAIRLLVTGRGHQLLTADLSGSDGAEDADVCGGRMTLWLEGHPLVHGP